MRNKLRETGGSGETDEGLKFELRIAPFSRFTCHSLFTLRLGQYPFRSGSFREPLYHG